MKNGRRVGSHARFQSYFVIRCYNNLLEALLRDDDTFEFISFTPANEMTGIFLNAVHK